MKAITNDYYGINLTLYPHDRIRDYNLPIVNLISYGQLHYFVAFGSGYETKKNGKIKSKWLFITDNGTMISSNGYAPFWRNQSPDPGIRYKVH